MVNYYHSPAGVLEITASAHCITSILFRDEPEAVHAVSHPVFDVCTQQLDEYFAGTRRHFNFPMEQSGTPFQLRVWKALEEIPFGRTVSYMELSRKLGDTKAIRAVGTANGRNRLAIVVPCHRVIGSNAALTGYAGGLPRKQWLLQHEAKHAAGVRTLF